MTALQDRATTTTDGRAGTLLTVSGVALVASSVAQLADELFAGPAVDIADTALYRSGAALHLAAYGLLVASVAVIARRRWAGNGISARIVIALLWAGTLGAVCAMWSNAFVVPLLADVAPELVNRQPALGLDLALATFVVAFVALGVAAVRARRVSRRTGGLLLASGLLFIVLPGMQLLVGLALLSGRSEAQD